MSFVIKAKFAPLYFTGAREGVIPLVEVSCSQSEARKFESEHEAKEIIASMADGNDWFVEGCP